MFNRLRFNIKSLVLLFIVSTNLNASDNSLIDLSRNNKSNQSDCTKERDKNYSLYATCVINGKSDIFSSIYKRHIRKKPDEKGDLTVKVTVNNKGEISTVEPVETNDNRVQLFSRVKSRLLHVKFEPSKSNNEIFIYKFMFQS